MPKRRRHTSRMDLHVPIPADRSLLPELLHNLASSGYTHVALVHTVYGRPQPHDHASQVLPTPLPHVPGLQILRRLHGILEQHSTVSSYSITTADTYGYDLISVAPRTEACWQALSTGTAHLVTLEMGQSPPATHCKLPPLELCYSPTILHRSHRKWMVKTVVARQQQRWIVSSGPRTTPQGDDAGVWVLRTPADVRNLVQTVLGLQDIVSSLEEVLRTNGPDVVAKAPDNKKRKNKAIETTETIDKAKSDEKASNDDDGFIAF